MIDDPRTVQLRAILADMEAASASVDEAVGTSEYQARLVALALIARHFLRECANQKPSGLRGDPGAPRTVNAPTRDQESSRADPEMPAGDPPGGAHVARLELQVTTLLGMVAFANAEIQRHKALPAAPVPDQTDT